MPVFGGRGMRLVHARRARLYICGRNQDPSPRRRVRDEIDWARLDETCLRQDEESLIYLTVVLEEEEEEVRRLELVLSWMTMIRDARSGIG